MNNYIKMTEYISFSEFNTKNMCRSCLLITEDVFPMSGDEINTYQNLTAKMVHMEDNVQLCLVCLWLLKKCVKFSLQCQKANELLLQNVKLDTKSPTLLQGTSNYDFRVTTTSTHYLGPELNAEDEEFITSEDNINDEDEIPLVMLQHDYKNNKKYHSFEPPPDLEIKIEPDIKEEYTENFSKPRSKKKKELKEGFSSRMVQETEEYVVIKLRKEQVLSELAEKAKAESYVRSPYKCEKCVKGFNFEDVLNTHMEKHTLEHGTYQCDICSQYCPNPVSLRGHIKSHTTRYKCKLCGQVRLSRQHLLEHHAITHTAAPTTYTCDKCHFTTNKRTVIQRHVKTHGTTERHACHRCGKLFNTIESLRVHTMRHDKTKRLQCSHCDKRFIYPSLLHKHVQAVHERKEYYCVECDVRFKSPESLRLHFKKAKRHRDSSSYKYECPHCPQRFVSPSTLAVHLTCTHGEPKQHTCALCRRQYSSREALRSHSWRVHSQRTTLCNICGGSFNRKSVLKVHMRTHSGDRPHVCECGATFTQKSTLKTHAAKHKKEDLITNGIETTSSMPQEG